MNYEKIVACFIPRRNIFRHIMVLLLEPICIKIDEKNLNIEHHCIFNVYLWTVTGTCHKPLPQHTLFFLWGKCLIKILLITTVDFNKQGVHTLFRNIYNSETYKDLFNLV